MARRPRQAPDPTRVIGYCQVSTCSQADSGLGMDAQRASILAECDRKGWSLVEMVEDAGFSAKDLNRPGMVHALELLQSGQAGALVVAKLDRATRSVIDASNLLAQGKSEGWALVALDLGLDPTTPTGELVATIMAGVGQWERRAIGARTREARREEGRGCPPWTSCHTSARCCQSHRRCQRSRCLSHRHRERAQQGWVLRLMGERSGTPKRSQQSFVALGGTECVNRNIWWVVK